MAWFAWNTAPAFILASWIRQDECMKVAYNWLKEFVDLSAPPQEMASRLALSGTNIAGIENNSHGPVIDAEVTSNRPDCLGMLGVARELSAIYRVPLKTISPKPQESS